MSQRWQLHHICCVLYTVSSCTLWIWNTHTSCKSDAFFVTERAVYNLFNSSVIKTDCVVSHDSIILYTVLKRMWPNVWYYPSICLEWLTKTMVLWLGQPLSWPGYELIINEANQEDHFFKPRYSISSVLGQGGWIQSWQLQHFSGSLKYVCRYFTLSLCLFVSGTHRDHSPTVIKI